MDAARVKCYKFSIPFVGEIEWEPDPTQRRAAWELYVELVTRISTQPLDMDQGVAREALNSLHSLFATTREVLRNAGPDVGAAQDKVGGVAIAVLRKGLRPFLTKWHPPLHAHEVLRPSTVSPRDWERQWKDEAKLRGELEATRAELETYAAVLAEMAGVKGK
ncbi:hypothetical protein HUA75_36375 [Myxococcus sp. CA040A]|nr:hypothetical protein [Myxococcus sp. CA040A]